jgi:MoxR-like ATPase
MLKIVVQYPSADEEFEILKRFFSRNTTEKMNDLKPVLDAHEILNIRNLVDQIYMEETLMKYIAGIIAATRNHKDIYLGASPRASLAIMRASKAIAGMHGRGFVTPDDIRYVTFPVLNHRLILTPESEMDGTELIDVVNDILKTIEVPR